MSSTIPGITVALTFATLFLSSCEDPLPQQPIKEPSREEIVFALARAELVFSATLESLLPSDCILSGVVASTQGMKLRVDTVLRGRPPRDVVVVHFYIVGHQLLLVYKDRCFQLSELYLYPGVRVIVAAHWDSELQLSGAYVLTGTGPWPDTARTRALVNEVLSISPEAAPSSDADLKPPRPGGFIRSSVEGNCGKSSPSAFPTMCGPAKAAAARLAHEARG